MSTIEQALADADKLTPYQGRDVLKTSIAIRNAGDGLSEAMGIEPQELAIGSHVRVVLDCEVVGHDHLPIKDTQALELKQVLKAGTATLIDAEVVDEALRAQAERIILAREQAAGVARMPDPAVEGSADEWVLQTAHDNGTHAEGVVEGCPACQAEVAAVLAEAHEAGGHAEAPGPIDGCPTCAAVEPAPAPEAEGEPAPPTPIGKASGRRSRAEGTS